MFASTLASWRFNINHSKLGLVPEVLVLETRSRLAEIHHPLIMLNFLYPYHGSARPSLGFRENANQNHMKSFMRFPNTLRARMTLVISALIIVASGTMTMGATFLIAESLLDAHQRLGKNLMHLSQPAVQRMLVEYDVAELRAYMKTLSGDPAIAKIRIIDDRGFNLYTFKRDSEKASWFTRLITHGTETPRILTTDFTIAGRTWGKMELTLSYHSLNEKVRTTVVRSIVFSVLVLIISLIVLYSLLTRFMRPLKPLTVLAQEFARGNWIPETIPVESGSKEIQELAQAFTDGSSAIQHYLTSLEETRELLEQSELQLRSLINGMRDVLLELDTEGHISFINPSWQLLTGYTIDESLGRKFSDFLDPEGEKIFAEDSLHKIDENNREMLLHAKDKGSIWVTLDANAQFDSKENFIGVIGTLGDITETVELNRMLTNYQEELYHLSVTDSLTDLFNRRHFDAQFDLILSDHIKQKKPLCLLLVDIDGFKFINDTYGHPFGDEVLKKVSGLLKQLVRRNDYIARLAGDEFAMVLKNTGIKNATRIAHKLHDNINQTQITLPVGHIQIQCCIGVAEAPTHGENTQALMSAADVALYQSKRAGRNRVRVLSPDISEATMTIFGQGFQIRNALESNNILPVFQPICDLTTGKPIAYEVLARIRHEDRLIEAKHFITVAEELGLTREVDLYVIERALMSSPIEYSLFVNVDLSSFNDPSFVRRLRDLIGPACESGRSITIEITERESVAITQELRQDLDALRQLGCKLALDDFGSGYSTYTILQLFKPDFLKIEGAFVQSMVDDDSSHKIVTHINELATSFGIRTIAENIETQEILDAVTSIGIANGQGYHLGLPEVIEDSSMNFSSTS